MVSIICEVFVCVVSLSQTSSREWYLLYVKCLCVLSRYLSDVSLHHLLYVDLVIFHHFTSSLLCFFVSPASFLLIGSRTFPFLWPTSVIGFSPSYWLCSPHRFTWLAGLCFAFTRSAIIFFQVCYHSSFRLYDWYVVYVFPNYNKIWTLQTVFSLTWTWIDTIFYKEP